MTLVTQTAVLHLGVHYEPGEVLPDVSPDLEADLVERGLLGEGTPSKPVPEETSIASASEVTDAGPDLSRLNKAQLSTMCDEAGIEVPSGATKKDLLKLLEGKS